MFEKYAPSISATYCGKGHEHRHGPIFYSLPKNLSERAKIQVPFKIGNYVTTEIHITEANPETKGSKSRPIGESLIIDIVYSNKEWRLRLKYLLCSAYNGNRWPHYSDVKVKYCKYI